MTRNSSLLLALALWPCLASCVHQDGPVKADDPDAPQLNPTPRQSVRIFGTIAPELEVKLVAGSDSFSPECRSDAPLRQAGGYGDCIIVARNQRSS